MGIFGSGSRKRGVFGIPGIDPYRTPGYGDGVGQHWDIEDGASIAQTSATQPQSTRQPSFWQGGDKFGVRDGIAGALAVIGDALAQRGGGQGGAVQMLAGGRMDAMEMARKAAEQARLEQAYIGAGLNPQQARLAAMGGAKYGDLAQKPETAPERVRTAEWWQKATPEQRAAFDQTNPIVTQGYGSTMVPRASLPQGGGPQAPAPGQIEDGYQFIGGDPTNPNSWKPVGGGGGNVTGGFPRR